MNSNVDVNEERELNIIVKPAKSLYREAAATLPIPATLNQALMRRFATVLLVIGITAAQMEHVGPNRITADACLSIEFMADCFGVALGHLRQAVQHLSDTQGEKVLNKKRAKLQDGSVQKSCSGIMLTFKGILK